MGYYLDQALFGRKIAKKIFKVRRFGRQIANKILEVRNRKKVRFLIASVGTAALIFISLFFICYWAYREIVRELNYQRKYGAGWQVEFEKYHGTLAQAHAKVAICTVGMLAIVAGLILFCRWSFRRRRRRQREAIAAFYKNS